MQGICRHFGALQSLGQLPCEEYIGQLALAVGLALIVGLVAVQIACVNFSTSVRQTGDINNPTGSGFLMVELVRRLVAY